MEDIDSQDVQEKDDSKLVEEYASEEKGVSFDDIVSFTMLLETTVTLVGIIIFFIFFVL